MTFEILSFTSNLFQKQAVNELIKCNDYTKRFGLVLTQTQAIELVETRFDALKSNRRIEFGGGVIEKIINEFYDSPYINRYNYTETIHELIEIFYFYKNETVDLISDEDLIAFMKAAFDGICQGSLELLSERELNRLADTLKYSIAVDYCENNYFGDEDEYE